MCFSSVWEGTARRIRGPTAPCLAAPTAEADSALGQSERPSQQQEDDSEAELRADILAGPGQSVARLRRAPGRRARGGLTKIGASLKGIARGRRRTERIFTLGLGGAGARNHQDRYEQEQRRAPHRFKIRPVPASDNWMFAGAVLPDRFAT